MRHGCVAGSQIQDPALMLDADGACIGLDEAHSTNPPPNPLGDMLGRNWCHRGGQRSRYDVNASSLCTSNKDFVERLVQNAYGNVAIRIGR